jgi:hypothetical protein
MNKYGFLGTILLVETDVFGKKEVFIADGQHRLATALYLNIEADAVIASFKPKTIAELVMFVADLNNTQKPWSLSDYITNYAYVNLTDYKELIRIKSNTPYTYGVIAAMLHGVRKTGTVGDKIRNGEFKILQLENTMETLKFAAELSKIGKLSGRMITSLHYVSSLKGFNRDKFMTQYLRNYECIKELNLDDYTDVFLSWLK